jgi:hypothetical protein
VQGRCIGMDVHRDFCEVAIWTPARSATPRGSRRGPRSSRSSPGSFARQTRSRWRRPATRSRSRGSRAATSRRSKSSPRSGSRRSPIRSRRPTVTTLRRSRNFWRPGCSKGHGSRTRPPGRCGAASHGERGWSRTAPLLRTRFATASPEAKQLMTVPGVGLVTATAFLAQVGDIARFRNPNRLVSYLGLDPKVRQSGDNDAHTGRISKEGSALVRHVLVEAAQTAIRSPGPLRAFRTSPRPWRPRRCDRRRRSQDGRPLLVPAQHRPRLRLLDADRHGEEAPRRRAQSRRTLTQRRRLTTRTQPRAAMPTRATLSRTCRERLPTQRRRLATPTGKGGAAGDLTFIRPFATSRNASISLELLVGLC